MPEPSEVEIAIDGGLMTVTVHGALTADLVVDVVRRHYRSFPGSHILWNMKSADFSAFSEKDFLHIATVVRDHTPAGFHRKTAYVASTQSAFVLLWKYLNTGISVHVPVEYKTFTDLDAAKRWLAGGH